MTFQSELTGTDCISELLIQVFVVIGLFFISEYLGDRFLYPSLESASTLYPLRQF